EAEGTTVNSRAPRIGRVAYHNFGILEDALLPLEPLTLIIGPNSSGKSTALRGIQWFRQNWNAAHVITLAARNSTSRGVDVRVEFSSPHEKVAIQNNASPEASPSKTLYAHGASESMAAECAEALSAFEVYRLNPTAIASYTQVVRKARLGEN